MELFLFRLQSEDKVHITFLLGKDRVAPLKQTTFRVELTAVVLDVQVHNSA